MDVIAQIQINNKSDGNCSSDNITLVSNSGGCFEVNQVLLMQVSEYYQALVSSGMKDSNNKILKFECLTNNNLEEISSYLSSLRNTSEKKIQNRSSKLLTQLEAGLEGAVYFQIDEMINQYSKFLVNSLDNKTWVHALDFANKYNLEGLTEKILDFISENFKELIEETDLLSLSSDEMSYIIKSDLVNAQCEFDIFNFIVKWISQDQERKVHAENLLSYVRYGLMTGNEKQEANDMLENLNVKLHQTDYIVRLRDTIGVVLALGGFTGKEFSTNRMQVLPLSDLKKISHNSNNNNTDENHNDDSCDNNNNNDTNSSRHMLTRRTNTMPVVMFRSNKKQKLPQTLCEHGACVVDGCLYVAGGQEHYCTDGRYTTNKVHVFNPVHSIWSLCSKMHVPRSLFYFGELDGHLYAVSGYTAPNTDTPTVEKYIPTEDRWCMLAPLPVKVHELAGCVYDHQLYVSGGFRGPDTGHVGLVWQYDPLHNAWSSKAPLLIPRSYHAMACVGKKLFAVGGVRYIGDDEFEDLLDGEMYDIETNQWSSVLKLLKPASCMSSLVVDECLYLFGGHSFKYNRDHNFVQMINLSKYSSGKYLKELTNNDSNKRIIPSYSHNNHNKYKYLRLDDESLMSKSNDDDDDCIIFKFEAQRIFYFNTCIINLTRKYVSQFH